MAVQETIHAILEEIRDCLSTVTREQIEALAERIESAAAVYVDGKGRSGMPAAGFAMRLGQMGRTAYVPAGVTTPPICSGDLLVICSGSGETEDLLFHAQKAKAVGAQVALVTASGASAIGKLADMQIVLRARSKWQPDFSTIQPMGSAFEQGLQILFDALVVMLMERDGITNEMMMDRHNNLE